MRPQKLAGYQFPCQVVFLAHKAVVETSPVRNSRFGHLCIGIGGLLASSLPTLGMSSPPAKLLPLAHIPAALVSPGIRNQLLVMLPRLPAITAAAHSHKTISHMAGCVLL